MPKAKASSPNSSKQTDKQPTHVAKVLSIEEFHKVMGLHNKGNFQDAINPDPIYGVIVYKAENFSTAYSTLQRSYLVGSNNPCFAYKGTVPKTMFGDCLDKSGDQGVRLDWLTWKVENCYVWENTAEAKLLDSYFAEGASQDEKEKLAAEAAKAEEAARKAADKAEAEKAKAAKAEAEKAKADPKPQKAEDSGEEDEGPMSFKTLIRLLSQQFPAEMAKLAKTDEETRNLVSAVANSLRKSWMENNLKKIKPPMVAECMSLITANVEKFNAKREAEKRAAKTAEAEPKAESKGKKGKAEKAEPKPEPKAESKGKKGKAEKAEPKPEPKAEPEHKAVPAETEKAKAKGPTKTEQAKSKKGKAASFPAPVKRRRK